MFKQTGPPLASLSLEEERALKLLLADDPACGDGVASAPGVLKLKYAGTIVYYSVGPNLTHIFLLNIEKIGGPTPPPATKQEKSNLKKVLDGLVAGGVIAAAKSGGKWLYEWLKDHWPM